MDELIKNFHDHIAAPFPKNLTGEEIEGIDLVLLDSESAATIDKYITHRRYLSEEEIKTANRCNEELEIVIGKLEGTNKDYFTSLYSIIQEILTSKR